MLIVIVAAVFIIDYAYFPKPPEDQLVVAISPFYLIDEYGQSGSDFNTANDFKEMLEAKKDLGIKVIMLDYSVRNTVEAKYNGRKVGAHLIVYGETRRKIGNIGEIKYHIFPLSSSGMILQEPFSGGELEENGLIFSEKATFSMITHEPIVIIESLTENATSSIYTIGAFEKLRKSEYASAIDFFKSIKNYENDSSIQFYIERLEALQDFDKAVRTNPQDAGSWNNKGVALFDLGMYDEAIASYNESIKLNNQKVDPWYNKGIALFELGKYEEALKSFDEAININPEDAFSWNNKGYTLHALERFGEALAAYDKANKIDPSNVQILNNKGDTLYAIEKYDEAIVIYEKAVEKDSQNAYAWNQKGNALSKSERYKEAFEAYNEALKIDPQYAAAWNNKGNALKGLGRNNESIEAYDNAIEIYPRYANAWSNKGVALFNLGKYDEAIEAYDEAIKIDPQHSAAWSGTV